MGILSIDEKFKLFYETAVQLQRREVELLFQRLNFFLIGTAFLITAFATVTTSSVFSSLTYINLVLLEHLISAVGYYIAIIFLFSNYLNTRTIRIIGDYIRGLEESENDILLCPLHLFLLKKTRELDSKPHHVIWDIIKTLYSLFRGPFEFHKMLPAPHTSIIPLGFIVFWIIIWSFVVPSYVFPLRVIGIIGIPVLLFLIYGLIQLGQYLRN